MDLLEIKLCKDCAHFTESMPQCHADQNREPDYVRGTGQGSNLWSAQAVRIGSDKCGPEARWFVPIKVTA
jgi:hypothetical protein